MMDPRVLATEINVSLGLRPCKVDSHLDVVLYTRGLMFRIVGSIVRAAFWARSRLG